VAAPAHAAPAAKQAAPATKAKPAAKVEAPANDECLACHADKDLKRSARRPGKGASVFVDPAVLKASPHDGLECVSCHTSATAPHDEKLPPVQCGGCHEDAKSALGQGVHGQPRNGAPAPACATCHGTHDIKPTSAMTADGCSACHATQAREWKESIHGRSRAAGSKDAATCTSCHGPAHTLVSHRDRRSPVYPLNLPRTCAQCHADPQLAKRYGIEVGDVYTMYMDSIHGRAISKSGLLVSANCSDCHGAHGIQPRSDPRSRVHRSNVPATCGGCHDGVLTSYRESIHGTEAARGNVNAPMCIDCHSAHEIRRVEAESWKLEIVGECGTCHAESLRTYRDTYHGKVTALGFSRVARCSDCHGAHDVLPKGDARSPIHETNVVATCRKCHPDANWNFAQYDPHANPEDVNRDPLLHYAWKFMTWLLVGTFSFFGLHTVLWGVRSLVGGRPGDPGDGRAAGNGEGRDG
jgi:hypothetical protein